MSSELRQNKLTGQWVIYAPERDERPRDFAHDASASTKQPQHEANCPFCPGNEAMLPDIILEYSTTGAAHWRTRVVPNKYPVLSPDQDETRRQDGLYVTMPGYGRHEVIIEHPRHNLDLADMSDMDVAAVIETYHRRYTDLMLQNRNMMVIIFRNHGRRAGTSIRHPHSQLVVTGVVPKAIRWREDIAQHYYDTWGRPLMGDLLDHERQVETRIVAENDSFVAFVPYAAEVPFEVWLVPRRPQADFGAIREAEKADLAVLLRTTLKRLQQVGGRPDYNYMLHSAARYRAGEPHLHWYVQVRPRTVTRAGFEIGSGMPVNPSLPENDAARLRDASV